VEDCLKTNPSLQGKALMLALTFLFILGTGCKDKGGKGDLMATVDGRKIYREEVDKYYRTQTAGSAQQPSGEQATNLRLSILRQLIDNEILMRRAEKLGLLATDDEVDRRITELKAPYTNEEFDTRLKEKQITLDDFKREIRRSLTVEKVLNKEITSKISISDQDISDYFKAHTAEFNFVEQQYHLARILVSPIPNPQAPNNKAQNDTEARKKIQTILNRLDSGDDFATLAANFSEDTETAGNGGDLQVAGGWIRIPIQGTFYVGLGVCSHDKDVSETAVFSNVDLVTPAPASGQTTLYSALSVVPIAGPDVSVVYIAPEHFEAPNWTPDGKSFIFNREGRIIKLPIAGGGKPETIDTGFATRVNNDHGISPDGTQLVISDQSQEKHDSLVYMLPLAGGTPRRITKNSPSYWHGWSPDGKTLAFVGQRDGEFDIYSIPVTGGDETRLTTAKGLDDGPEYSPDGNYIFYQHSDPQNEDEIVLFSVPSLGGTPQRILGDLGTPVSFSPDGKQRSSSRFC